MRSAGILALGLLLTGAGFWLAVPAAAGAETGAPAAATPASPAAATPAPSTVQASPTGAAQGPPRAELERELGQVRELLRLAEEGGQERRAEFLRARLRELQGLLRGAAAGEPGLLGRGRRLRLEKMIEALQSRHDEALAAGQDDEARRLQGELEGLRRQLAELGERGEGPPPWAGKHPGEGGWRPGEGGRRPGEGGPRPGGTEMILRQEEEAARVEAAGDAEQALRLRQRLKQVVGQRLVRGGEEGGGLAGRLRERLANRIAELTAEASRLAGEGQEEAGRRETAVAAILQGRLDRLEELLAPPAGAGETPPAGATPPPAGEIQALRQEVEELRRQLQALSAELEQERAAKDELLRLIEEVVGE